MHHTIQRIKANSFIFKYKRKNLHDSVKLPKRRVYQKAGNRLPENGLSAHSGSVGYEELLLLWLLVAGCPDTKILERRNTFIYREIQMISLIGIAVTAALCDLWAERIPNAVIAVGLVMGLVYQLFEEGPLGLILFSGGVLLPILLLGGLYYFRMLGAGDIKLLCVVGGFLGPVGVLGCFIRSVFVAGVISLVILCRCHELGERLRYFGEYVSGYLKNRQWKPYLDGVKGSVRICFSVPVLIGILLCL